MLGSRGRTGRVVAVFLGRITQNFGRFFVQANSQVTYFQGIRVAHLKLYRTATEWWHFSSVFGILPSLQQIQITNLVPSHVDCITTYVLFIITATLMMM